MAAEVGPPNPGCASCALLQQEVSRLSGQIEQLETKVRGLEARLKLDSTNSSKPPSSDAPWKPRPSKAPSGRKPGGQPQHRGHFRRSLPTESVTEVIEHRPAQCRACGQALPQSGDPAEGVQTRHQVAELPQQPLEIQEHRSYAATCPCCGVVTRGEIPAEVRAHILGPRLAAHLCWLVALGHVSRRQVVEYLRVGLGLRVSLGSLSAYEQELSQALAAQYEAIQAKVRQAPCLNIDETSWQQFRESPWLWVLGAADAVLYGIRGGRSSKQLRELLGDLGRERIIGADRYGVYNWVPSVWRQFCWAHLLRDFARLELLGQGAEVVGRAGLQTAKEVFRLWHSFKQNALTREEFRVAVQPLRDEFQAVLQKEQQDSPSSQARNFAGRLLRKYPALWTFVEREGVEPTNNEAERLLRPLVQWRKNSYGCHSKAGCEFVERIMSVVQTLRRQGRDVLGYLTQALLAHRQGLAPPALFA
jgi:transposase